MRDEYETVAQAGFVLQIDCPDLGMGRHIQYADLDLKEFRKRIGMHIEALNHATRNIPPEQLRMHLCWGNYEGPHHYDVPLADIIDIVFTARPNAISLEAANPRHAHEWTVFETVKLPDGKVLIPGVIESKSNFIEHPELIAQRIGRYAELVGRENVIAGSDCGYGTWVGQAAVDPDVVWAKLAAMAEGARIASKQFWTYQTLNCVSAPCRARPLPRQEGQRRQHERDAAGEIDLPVEVHQQNAESRRSPAAAGPASGRSRPARGTAADGADACSAARSARR